MLYLDYFKRLIKKNYKGISPHFKRDAILITLKK